MLRDQQFKSDPQISLFVSHPAIPFLRAHWLAGAEDRIVALSTDGRVFLSKSDRLTEIERIAEIQAGVGVTDWDQQRSTLVVLSSGALVTLSFEDQSPARVRVALGRNIRPITAVCQEATTRRFAIGTDDGQIWVRGSSENGIVNGLRCLAARPSCTAWSPYDAYIACGLSSGFLTVIGVDSTVPEPLVDLGDLFHSCPVTSIVWSADARFYAAGLDGSIYSISDELGRRRGARIFNEARLLARLPSPVVSLALSPDRRTLAAGSCEGQLYLVSTAHGVKEPCRSGHTGWIASVSWHPSGRKLLTAGDDNMLRIWDGETGISVPSSSTQVATPRLISLNKKSTRAAMLCSAKDLLIAEGRLVRPLFVNAGLTTLAFHPVTTELAFGTSSGQVLVTRARTDRGEIAPLLTDSSPVEMVCWKPTGDAIFAVTRLGLGVMFQLASGEARRVICPTGAITAACWLEDGKSIAFGADDGSVFIWSVAEIGLPLTHFVGHTHPISEVLPLPVGLLSRDIAGELRVWSPEHGRCQGIFSHERSLSSFTLYIAGAHAVISVTPTGAFAILDSLTLQGTTGQIPVGPGRILKAIPRPESLTLADNAYYKTIYPRLPISCTL